MSMIDNLHIIERKILYKELKPLFEAMSSVNYAVVKGEVLSQQIYGVPDRRRSSDIDILIDKSNVKFLENELQKLGFEQQLPEDPNEARRNRVLCMAYSHQIPSYHKEKSIFHLNVDVNYDIFWGEYEGRRFSIEKILNDTVNMKINGVTVKTLPIEMAFVQLILHHYKEMNSLYHLSQHNCICTDMFRDVYDMIRNNLNILTIERVAELSEQYLIGSYVQYMIYYTYKVFADIILADYLRKLKKYKNIKLLESYGLSSYERKKWDIPFIERLNCQNVFSIIESQLNQEDERKITDNTTIFT